MFAKSAAPARPKRSLRGILHGALLEVFALSCFAAAIALALVAIGLAITPVLGAAGALAVDAGLVAAMGLAVFPWARGRSEARASALAGPPPDALPAQISALLKQEKGLSIVAGLLVGVLAGGSGIRSLKV